MKTLNGYTVVWDNPIIITLQNGSKISRLIYRKNNVYYIRYKNEWSKVFSTNGYRFYLVGNVNYGKVKQKY